MENETNTIVVEPKKQGALSKALDKVFHFTQRGSTMGSEIGAGLGAFFISVCALLMNTRIIGEAYGSYAGAYLATALIAFLGTILLGVVANLPLVQSANMGLSTVMIALMGAEDGLTYPNLMAVTFVAAVLYLVVVLTPAKKFLVEALPEGVKKAMPVGVGLYVAWTALKNTGLVTAAGTAATASGLGILDTYYFWLMIAAAILFVVMKAFNRNKSAMATLQFMVALMWIGGIVFFMDQFMGGQTAATIVYQRLNLVFATDGANPYNLSTGLASLKIGELFTKGFDFSAYTGSVPLLFLSGVLNFLLLGLYTNLGSTKATAVVGDYADSDYAAKGENKALVVGAVLNVAAPVLGAAPTSIGTQSAVAANDKAKTGLASLSAAVGYLIALFSWVFIMLFATGTNGVGMWIEDTEVKLAAYVQDTFVFADLIMVLVGAGMLKGIRNVRTDLLTEWVPFAATVLVTAFLGNIALGVALGCVTYLICKAAGKKRKELTGSSIALGVAMLIIGILMLM